MFALLLVHATVGGSIKYNAYNREVLLCRMPRLSSYLSAVPQDPAPAQTSRDTRLLKHVQDSVAEMQRLHALRQDVSSQLFSASTLTMAMLHANHMHASHTCVCTKCMRRLQEHGPRLFRHADGSLSNTAPERDPLAVVRVHGAS